MYWFFKDFAGPIATIIASATAAVFVHRQWRTAENQAATALDQLRYNLFEKRYAIYDEVKQLLRLLLNDSHKPEFDPWDARPHFVAMDEAIFFFSPETCAWLQSVRQDCQKFLQENVSKKGTPDYDNAQRKLLEHFEAMPERFREELGFRQLTQKLPPHT